MKKVKLHLIVENTIPTNAEIIRFTDEEQIASDHIKIGGKLFQPDVHWMEYMPSGPGTGIGWESGTPLCSKLWEQTGYPEWYMEEVSKP